MAFLNQWESIVNVFQLNEFANGKDADPYVILDLIFTLCSLTESDQPNVLGYILAGISLLCCQNHPNYLPCLDQLTTQFELGLRYFHSNSNSTRMYGVEKIIGRCTCALVTNLTQLQLNALVLWQSSATAELASIPLQDAYEEELAQRMALVSNWFATL